MTNNFLGISIPEPLRCYCRVLQETENFYSPKPEVCDFGVKLIKDANGKFEFAAYYSDTGELLKKIYYKGSVLEHIEYFRNNLMHMREDFIQEQIKNRIKYDKNGNIKSKISYEYDKKNHITSITKQIDKSTYCVEYGYDELQRINSRTLSMNDKEINKQFYRYDILDRIVMYKDKNQCITVKQIGKNNELIYYVIEDKILNEISVYNRFINSEYIDSEICLNGHKMILKDNSYVDNVMLKKPYTREDDLDFMISSIYKTETEPTKRNLNSTATDFRISSCMQAPTLPISIRKCQLLYNKV